MKQTIYLTEADLQPDNYVQNNALNKWRVLYNIITNLKNVMEITYRDNNGKITGQLYQEIVNYIHTTFSNMGIKM
jgi:hypothetical protein